VFSVLLELYSAEKVGVCPVQVPERLLRGALGDLVEPGEVGLLEGVQLAVEVYG
jgi:hypothetical protein